jgi:hypothetical protein
MLATVLFAMNACKKTEALTIPPEQVHFMGVAAGTYSVTAPGVVYKIPIGLTTVSGSARNITISVTSKTGAVEGTHYSINTKSLTIAAGKAVDTIVVSGVFAQYQSGRKDTLVFTVQGDGVAKSDYNSTFTLAMRGPCFEGDVDLNQLLGAYLNTNEDFGGPYGPYTTTISAITQAPGATTGTIRVTNIFDAGWNPITFTLDWTNPAARTVTLVSQSGIGNAGTISATYAGQDITVRPFAGQVGTFSICNQTLTLKMQLGVTGVGFFGTLYTVTMAR